MIEIKYLGANSFRIKQKSSYLVLGQPSTKISADVFLLGRGGKKNEKLSAQNRDQPFVVTGPGEYEVSGIEIWGGNDGFWLVRMGAWRICFVDQDWKIPDEKKVAGLDRIDILFLPLTGGGADAKKTVETVKRVSPLIMVPGTFSSADDLSWAKDFLDAMDLEDLEPREKLKLERKDLPEETQIILLKK